MPLSTPWKIKTWNLQITNLAGKMISQTSNLGFYVKFPGCSIINRQTNQSESMLIFGTHLFTFTLFPALGCPYRAQVQWSQVQFPLPVGSLDTVKAEIDPEQSWMENVGSWKTTVLCRSSHVSETFCLLRCIISCQTQFLTKLEGNQLTINHRKTSCLPERMDKQ